MLRYDHGGDVYENAGVRLDFSVNTNPLGMPEGVKRALVSHLADYERYPDPQCRALTAALAIRFGLEPDMALCGGGAADLIFRICACLKPGRALVLAPTFSEYGRSVALFGGETRAYRLDERDSFTLRDDILDALTGDIDMVFLCNPNNPTGRLAPPELVAQIAKRCEANGTYLVVDECFLEFTDGESAVPLLKAYPRMMVLNAFTKLYAMAGLRLGYLLCADAALLSRIGTYGQTWSVSGPAQAAGLAALKEESWAERTRRLIWEERAYMTGKLCDLGLHVFPSEANFLLLRSEAPLYGPLLERGILVRNCANFEGLGEGYIRVGLKTREQNKALLRALSEVLYG